MSKEENAVKRIYQLTKMFPYVGINITSLISVLESPLVKFFTPICSRTLLRMGMVMQINDYENLLFILKTVNPGEIIVANSINDDGNINWTKPRYISEPLAEMLFAFIKSIRYLRSTPRTNIEKSDSYCDILKSVINLLEKADLETDEIKKALAFCKNSLELEK